MKIISIVVAHVNGKKTNNIAAINELHKVPSGKIEVMLFTLGLIFRMVYRIPFLIQYVVFSP